MSFPPLLPIPAIDLMEGQVVRLRRGLAAEKTIYSDDPAAIARGFEAEGAKRIHVVDLDGAFKGLPLNIEALKAIRGAVSAEIEVGGGLRTQADVERLFDLGINYAILGTSAVRDRELVARLIGTYGPRIIVGIDAKDGMVAVEGWVETSDLSQLEFARQLHALGLDTIIATDIATDGMMKGPNLASLASLADATPLKLIASGGVSRIEDLTALRELDRPNLFAAIIGRAIYEGQIQVAAAVAAGA